MLRKLTAKPIAIASANRLISQILDQLEPVTEIEKIVLFGSAARGELTDTSDIDILIIITGLADLKASQKKVYKARKAIDWPIDFVFATQETFDTRKKLGGLFSIVDKEGITIFERNQKNDPAQSV